MPSSESDPSSEVLPLPFDSETVASFAAAAVTAGERKADSRSSGGYSPAPGCGTGMVLGA